MGGANWRWVGQIKGGGANCGHEKDQENNKGIYEYYVCLCFDSGVMGIWIKQTDTKRDF